jgi:predicted porin
MKKSALALAVAAGLVGFGSAAYADTTLYGSARVSVDYDEIDTIYNDVNGVLVPRIRGSDVWDLVDNTSRLGVRGEEDLGGGLSAVYQYEFGVDTTEGGNFSGSPNRPKLVGLKGNSWGSVTLGTQWTPYYGVIGVGDIFNSKKMFDKFTYLGDAFGLRLNNSLLYSSPNWSGFGFQAMLVVNGSGETPTTVVPNQLGNLSDDVDLWNIAATYKNGPFFAGATYMSTNNSNDLTNIYGDVLDDRDQWGVAFGYNAGPFGVTLSYENGDLNNLYFEKSEAVYLTGSYAFGNNVIRASYGYINADEGQVIVDVDPLTIFDQPDIQSFGLGYQYNFSKRTRVFVEYVGKEVDSDLGGDRQTVSIGTRHDF